MKELNRIILINWYLFTAKEFEIRGHTALLGPNGAGKSSFIDAVQYVMLGGNKKLWKPNAKAPGKDSIRKIKDYVLGKIDVSRSNGNEAAYKQRENALCRIALVFRDTETGQETTVGCAIAAHEADDSEKVEGFFILDQYGLRLGDMLNAVPGGSMPKSYSELKAHLQQLGRNQGVYVFNNSAKYINQLLVSLGPKTHQIDPKKYSSSFKKSIAMSNLDGSVSDFVKTSILHPEEIQVDALRDSYASYKSKKDEVAKTKKQIEELSVIRTGYKRAVSAAERYASYLWCLAELNYNHTVLEIDDSKDTMTESLCSFKDASKKLKLTIQQYNNESERRIELSALIQQDDSENQKARLESEKKEIEGKLTESIKQINAIRLALSKSSEIARYQSILSEDCYAILEEMAKESEGAPNTWPQHVNQTESVIKKAKPLLSETDVKLEQHYESCIIDKSKLENEEAVLYRQLEQAKNGQTPLSQSAQNLHDRLIEQGFKAEPICQLIEVKDKSWQPAIEAYLKKQTEALLVPIDQAVDAVQFYRDHKNDFIGAKVINTLKVKDWNDTIRQDTAASLITGKSELAVKYIQRILKDVELIDSTKDLMKRNRAITKDGMEQGGGSVQGNRISAISKLGAMTKHQVKALADELKEISQQLRTVKDEQRKYKQVRETLSRVLESMSDKRSLSSMVDTRTDLLKKITDKDDSIAAIDTSKTKELRKQVDDLKISIEGLNKKRDQYSNDKGKFGTLFKSKKKLLKELNQNLSSIKQDRKNAEEESYFSQDKASELYDKLADEFIEKKIDVETIDGFNKATSNVNSRKESAYRNITSTGDEANRELELYNQRYGAEGVEIEFMEQPDLRKRYNSVDAALEGLEKLGLHTRENDLEQALQKMMNAVRDDVAVKLNSQINQMIRRIQELNKELAKRPFSSGVTYKFIYNRKTEYSDFLKFIESMNQVNAANNNSLFDDDRDNHFETIREMIEEERNKELLDYSNYFTYDINIIDKVNGKDELFSEKKKAGSGGEQSTPFYVAMGASLASTYRIESSEENGMEGGFSMYLADEAFQGMDRKNTRQTTDYLKAIGLQLFLAAPDESEFRFTEFVDTKLFFTRHGHRVAVTTDYITQGTKSLFKKAYKEMEKEVEEETTE